MTDIMSLHCLFQTHSKTELMYLKNKQVWTRISVACFENRVHFLLMVLIYSLLPVKTMDTEEVLQQVSCAGYTDTGTCQM